MSEVGLTSLVKGKAWAPDAQDQVLSKGDSFAPDGRWARNKRQTQETEDEEEEVTENGEGLFVLFVLGVGEQPQRTAPGVRGD